MSKSTRLTLCHTKPRNILPALYEKKLIICLRDLVMGNCYIRNIRIKIYNCIEILYYLFGVYYKYVISI